MGSIGSQNTLIGIVFVTRLLSFLPFDIVSYFAGLTGLSFWRFLLAMFVWTVPASFLVAQLGKEVGTCDADRILFGFIALGRLTLVPIGIKLFRDWPKRRKSDELRRFTWVRWKGASSESLLYPGFCVLRASGVACRCLSSSSVGAVSAHVFATAQIKRLVAFNMD